MLKNPKIADKPSRMTSRLLLVSLLASTVGGTLLLSCSAHDGGTPTKRSNDKPSPDVPDAGEMVDASDSSTDFDDDYDAAPSPTCTVCSVDGTKILDCETEAVVATCNPGELCTADGCKEACEAAVENRSSIGCEYYAVMLDGGESGSGATNGCFVAFVANTSNLPAHLEVSLGATTVDLAAHARIPKGTGSSLVYQPYDPSAGLAPGEVVILFLGGGASNTSGVKCPIPSAFPHGASAGMQVNGTGRGRGVRIRSDVPVVAYQMFPYGGGQAAVTGASLLLPTSVWDTNYIAVNAYERSQLAGTNPSMTLVAMEDATEITILPHVAIQGGNGVASSPAGTPVTYTLQAGETLQIAQAAELTGSPIEATKPIGLFAAHACMNVPANVRFCDHGEQQIPPVRALGSEYVGVTHRPRTDKPENPPWRIIGAVDGTQLFYEPDVGGPTTINQGEVREFRTNVPFVVRSQDEEHPFLLVTYMTGSEAVKSGYGDADFVRISPAAQYLNRYVFFTDPTYAETNLVVVRKRGKKGFADVHLSCAGTLSGWQPVGSQGEYEYTRIDLVTGNFVPQNGCNNGRHEMSSEGTFGLWVWGWGTPVSNPDTKNVSYGYPAGENVQSINTVTVPAMPR